LDLPEKKKKKKAKKRLNNNNGRKAKAGYSEIKEGKKRI